MKKIIITNLALLCLLSINTLCASSVTTEEAVDTDGLDNITMSGIDPLAVSGAELSAAEPFCVYSNETATGTFKITFESSNGAEGTYTLAGTGAATGESIDYAVSFSPDSIDGSGTTITPAANAPTASALGSVPSATCITGAGEDNVSIKLSIPEAQAVGTMAGTYTDTLTVSVTRDSIE